MVTVYILLSPPVIPSPPAPSLLLLPRDIMPAVRKNREREKSRSAYDPSLFTTRFVLYGWKIIACTYTCAQRITLAQAIRKYAISLLPELLHFVWEAPNLPPPSGVDHCSCTPDLHVMWKRRKCWAKNRAMKKGNKGARKNQFLTCMHTHPHKCPICQNLVYFLVYMYVIHVHHMMSRCVLHG